MEKIKKIFLFYILIIFLYSCGTASEVGQVMRNQKIKTTDEFLVKKREPLTLPPEYNELPQPGSVKNTKNSEKNKIDKILSIPDEKIVKKKKASSVEQSIINEIRK